MTSSENIRPPSTTPEHKASALSPKELNYSSSKIHTKRTVSMLATALENASRLSLLKERNTCSLAIAGYLKSTITQVMVTWAGRAMTRWKKVKVQRMMSTKKRQRMMMKSTRKSHQYTHTPEPKASAMHQEVIYSDI